MLQLYPKIILIWIPGHNQIPGNEKADAATKYTNKAPLISVLNHNFGDIKAFLKRHLINLNIIDSWANTSPWYKTVNPKKLNIKSYLCMSRTHDFSRLDIVKFLRIRLGHCRLTHEHILNHAPPPRCSLCRANAVLTIEHILMSCSSLQNLRSNIFKDENPMLTMQDPTPEYIAKVIQFLKTCNIYHHI